MKTVRWIKKAMELSSDFAYIVGNDAYENAMQEQAFFADDANIKGYLYHDNYSSFVLTVLDRDAVIKSMANSGMYSELPETKKAAAALKRFNEMAWNNKNYDMLDCWLDEQAKNLLSIYEKDLHTFEDCDYQLELFLEEYQANEWSMYDNYRISGGQVIKHIPSSRAHDVIL